MLLEYIVFFGLIFVIFFALAFSKKKSNAIDFDEPTFYDDEDLDEL
ncbi:MAG: hypothetical protein AAFX55_09080 [Bacteroidota bacterium]